MTLKHSIAVIIGLVAAVTSFSQGKFDKHLVEVEIEDSKELLTFVKTPDLFEERWDTLAQPNFWKFVMQMSPGTSILNVRATRQILEITSLEEWNKKSDDEKEAHRALLRKENGLPEDERIFMTTGKNDFYQFDKVFPSISKGVNIFIDNDTDPWYAQAILMIESPGKLAYSNVGALGPFQIMKSVARNHGLRVDKYVDERKDFDKSAMASSHLIRTACIPEAKRIMRKFGIEVKGEEQYKLWFRLLVLHCYHAGAGNVDRLMVNVIKPKAGGQQLIDTIWHSEYGQFGNSSQNYSQLALASLLILDNLIFEKCSAVQNCAYEK
ncbi:MAG: transglycosylase SLT domain-containing protein [Crocinitomicaceae bacterium]